MECGEKLIAAWTGDTYVCVLKGVHLYHKGYCDDYEREWPNSRDYCATPFPNTNDMCKRPPQHKGSCRVKIHGKLITFRVKR